MNARPRGPTGSSATGGESMAVSGTRPASWLVGFRRVLNGLRLAGLDLPRMMVTLRELPRWFEDRKVFVAAGGPIPMGRLYPVFGDREGQAGAVGGHYFHQDLYFARAIWRARPQRHVDIGSRIDGFVAHLLTFMDVEVIDIRPIRSKVAGLTFIQADATRLELFRDGELPSLSCLHAAEHFGLGRYGDPIDPWGHEKLIGALQRVVAPGGRIYFSVPVGGVERVEFNAHRIFRTETIIRLFSRARLCEFALVDDSGDLITAGALEKASAQTFGCGLFTFERC